MLICTDTRYIDEISVDIFDISNPGRDIEDHVATQSQKALS